MLKLSIFIFVLIISLFAFVQQGMSAAVRFANTTHPGNIFEITYIYFCNMYFQECVFLMNLAGQLPGPFAAFIKILYRIIQRVIFGLTINK